MRNTSKIAVICNNRMAVPAIQHLLNMGCLCGIGVPEHNDDVLPYLEDLALKSGISFIKLNKESLTDDLLFWTGQIDADALFIMTFPWLVPAKVLAVLPNKIYNFHYGLLPEMKGADPVFESIRQQKKETGITIHIADQKIDNGPKVLQKRITIDDTTTHGMLCTQLSFLAAQMCNELYLLITEGKVQTYTSQLPGHYYPRPTIKEVTIDWLNMDSYEIHALARACNPWNKGAYAIFKGWNFRICSFSFYELRNKNDPGKISIVDQDLIITCKDQRSLKIDIISTDEGFYPGAALKMFGLNHGDYLFKHTSSEKELLKTY